MGFFDFFSSMATNKTNYNINSRNLINSWKAFHAQNQFNVQQWNRENAYNTPSAQMQRFAAAGINPWNAISNVTGGDSSSVTSAPYSQPNMIPMQAPPDPLGGLINNVSSSLDSTLKILDIIEGKRTLSDSVNGSNAFNQSRVLDYIFNRDTVKNKTAAYNMLYKSQEFTAANEAAYQLALTKFGMSERAATTFSNWITSRQTGRQTLENMKDQHLINGKVLDWYDKDHEASFEKQMASAGVDRQQIKRMKKELPFIADYMQAVIDELDSRANLNNENATDLRATRSHRIANLDSQTGLNDENANDLRQTRPARVGLSLALENYNKEFAEYYRKQNGWVDFNNKKAVVNDIIDAYLRYRQQNLDDKNAKDRNSTSEKLGLGSLLVHILPFIM